jgi:hypothetical protein
VIVRRRPQSSTGLAVSLAVTDPNGLGVSHPRVRVRLGRANMSGTGSIDACREIGASILRSEQWTAASTCQCQASSNQQCLTFSRQLCESGRT